MARDAPQVGHGVCRGSHFGEDGHRSASKIIPGALRDDSSVDSIDENFTWGAIAGHELRYVAKIIPQNRRRLAVRRGQGYRQTHGLDCALGVPCLEKELASDLVRICKIWGRFARSVVHVVRALPVLPHPPEKLRVEQHGAWIGMGKRGIGKEVGGKWERKWEREGEYTVSQFTH
jgi:hypothetical protein